MPGHNFRYLLLSLLLASQLVWAGAYADFFKAIEEDRVEVIQPLLKRGMDSGMLSPQLLPAYLVAAQSRAWKSLALLLATPPLDVDARNHLGETALMLAAYAGQLSLCERLIELDATINQPGWTALHYAATTGQDAVIQLLLAHDAYIDAESPNQTTPLMMAARAGNRSSVKLLVESGADPAVVNQQGYSAARFAKEFGDLELAAWLERQNIDFRVKHGLPLISDSQKENKQK